MEKLPTFKSKRNNDVTFWALKTLWQVAGTMDDVHNHNMMALDRALEHSGDTLTLPQRTELYQNIMQRVIQAAAIDGRTNPGDKRICRDEFLEWVKEMVGTLTKRIAGGNAQRLKTKMEQAGLDSSAIDSAIYQRVSFRREVGNRGYLDLSHRDMVMGSVNASLQYLRSQLDTGALADDGLHFHATCLSELHKLCASIPASTPSTFEFAQGCMYDMTDRCVHRFRRRSP